MNGAIAEKSVQKKTNSMQETPTIEHIHDDGLYWNHQKIAGYSVPLFMHYYFKIWAIIPMIITIDAGGDPGQSIDRVEFYINGVLHETIVGPGPEVSWSYNVTITPFHHSTTIGIKVVCFDSGEVISDNVTIYRLFP